MKSFLLKALIASRAHERVRGGHRLARMLAGDMASVPIAIRGYPPLYVDLRGLDAHALSLYRAAPLESVPHEPELSEVFHRVIRPTDTVFDIGANLGLHTLTFSKLAHMVVAFEANPSLTPNLRRTVANLPNARALEVCLSDRDGTAQFHISPWDHMLGSMANWTGQPTKTLTLPARALDSLIAEGSVPTPDVLKVDVEGAELLVFRGADRVFSGEKPLRIVMFEELNSASTKLGLPEGGAAAYLRSKGYALHLLRKEGIMPAPEVRPPAANLIAVRGHEL